MTARTASRLAGASLGRRSAQWSKASSTRARAYSPNKSEGTRASVEITGAQKYSREDVSIGKLIMRDLPPGSVFRPGENLPHVRKQFQSIGAPDRRVVEPF